MSWISTEVLGRHLQRSYGATPAQWAVTKSHAQAMELYLSIRPSSAVLVSAEEQKLQAFLRMQVQVQVQAQAHAQATAHAGHSHSPVPAGVCAGQQMQLGHHAAAAGIHVAHRGVAGLQVPLVLQQCQWDPLASLGHVVPPRACIATMCLPKMELCGSMPAQALGHGPVLPSVDPVLLHHMHQGLAGMYHANLGLRGVPGHGGVHASPPGMCHSLPHAAHAEPLGLLAPPSPHHGGGGGGGGGGALVVVPSAGAAHGGGGMARVAGSVCKQEQPHEQLQCWDFSFETTI